MVGLSRESETTKACASLTSCNGKTPANVSRQRWRRNFEGVAIRIISVLFAVKNIRRLYSIFRTIVVQKQTKTGLIQSISLVGCFLITILWGDFPGSCVFSFRDRASRDRFETSAPGSRNYPEKSADRPVSIVY